MHEIDAIMVHSDEGTESVRYLLIYNLPNLKFEMTFIACKIKLLVIFTSLFRIECFNVFE